MVINLTPSKLGIDLLTIVLADYFLHSFLYWSLLYSSILDFWLDLGLAVFVVDLSMKVNLVRQIFGFKFLLFLFLYQIPLPIFHCNQGFLLII